MTFRGPRLFMALATCPTGRGYGPSQGYRVAKLALDTGVRPLKEAVHGVVRHAHIPERRRPVEEYLCMQRRFQHLFVPQRQDEILRCIHAAVGDCWNAIARPELFQGAEKTTVC